MKIPVWSGHALTSFAAPFFGRSAPLVNAYITPGIHQRVLLWFGDWANGFTEGP